MTKEEAIKLLRQIYPNGGHCWLDSQRIEAIEMAISALSKPSLPPDLDEATNRQAALEQPYKWEEEQDGSFGVTPLFVMSNIRSAFKAGVEWMAGRGETKEGEVLDRDEFIKFSDGTYIDLDPTLGLIPAFKLKDGDKVVVQIRKK